MSAVYEKSPDGSLKVVETVQKEFSFKLKVLRMQKQILKARLDEVQSLIDQAILLQVDED